jgi:hypothetical protein
MTVALRRRAFAAVAAAHCALAAVARGQACPTTETRVAPEGVQGAYIRSVAVKTDAPIPLPSVTSRLSALRRRTETSVVARQLLFTAGDRLDSSRVAETLRRLRDQRLYADIALQVTRCANSDTVDLVVATRDAWTLRPVARVVPPSTVSLGVEDRNVLGTARTLALSDDQTSSGHGGTVTAVDPWLFGENLIGSTRLADVAGAHLFRASLRTHERSTFDPWRVEIAGGRQSFAASTDLEHPVQSTYEIAHAGHLIDSTRSSATVLYVGAQRDEGRFISIQPGDDGVPQPHSRDFVGADAGLQVRTTRFETASWFTGGRGLLDIPTGLQGDLFLSAGRERVENEPALHYDAWVGKMWTPTDDRLFTLDTWTSGYIGYVRPNHIDRISASGFLEAPRGFWGARVMLEQLIQVDPDLRMLSLAGAGADPSFAAVPSTMRQANRSLVANVERSVHIMPIARASMLDGAVFVAGSRRWDSSESAGERFDVAVAGLRLRFFSANGAFSSIRVDVGYPIVASASVVHRPLLSIGLTSLIDAPHLRDDRRRQQ